MIDTSKIEGYENMSAEEKLQAIQNADLSQLGMVDNKVFDKTASDLAKANKDSRKQASENQTEIDTLREELNTLKAENERAKTKAAIMPKFLGLGMSAEEALAATEHYLNGETDEIFEALSAMTAKIVQKAAADSLLKQPVPKDFGGGKPMTKEAFSKLSLPDRIEFSNTHPEEYQALYNN